VSGEFPVFRPRPPWLTGDLQTLRNNLRRPRHDLSSWPETPVDLPLADGSGDRLLGHLHRPVAEAPRGLVILVHGLTGCADSTYVRATARHLLSLGYAVLRLNLRGAGPARPLARFQYHAGRTADLRAALAGLGTRDPALVASGVFAVGYSLGANMLLKFLGEEGARATLRGAAAISAPIDLHAASLCLMTRRNRFYHRYLMSRMIVEAVAPTAALTEDERQAAQSARTVYQFDDRFVAPRNGFAGAADYYARCSAEAYLAAIKTPTLIVHALDDPWIPADAYRRQNWSRAPSLTPLLPAAGGHVGFHGADSRVPWHDRCLAAFFERIRAPGG
jgi:predicted alpha/beta-fold hydrolase